ncbi:outer membrane channel, putative [Geotalea daltonii FRC-32]|uniref:Outer membrane channel, putative n=1 Tax=Geotalea daltonii (strain DSM 22248 / JCM 15807 / FRC-32) TaxID=316067 RepID=B9M6I2_GEODF|nr:hypothetical protein [Geotalea daltonii]ACM20042.1 outer membrane channel, putative [Geotalea daltonii FRC-32]
MGYKRVWHWLLLVFLLSGTNGWAAEIHGRSSTQVLWFNDFYNGRQIEAAEYLRLSATKLTSDGKFSIYGYGRGTQDFTNGEGLNGRLYFLYGDYRDLLNVLDVKVGRQFVNLSAGTTIIDGGELIVKNIGPVGLTVLGGRDVVFGIDGELGHAGNYAFGAAAYLNGLRKTDLDISWLRKWDSGDVSRDIMGASFKQYLLDRVKLYGNARYDLTAEVFNEVLGGVKYFPSANLVLTGEWFQSYPTFDTTDIFSVFAADRYQEGVIRADYTINKMLSVYGGYIREEFGDGASANVIEAGINLRPLPDLQLTFEYDRRVGIGSDDSKLDGGLFEAAWDMTKAFQLAGGLSVDAYDREIFHSSTGEQIAQKYWLGSRLKLANNMSASLRIEDDINVTYNNNVQGRFIFNYDF